MLQTLSSQPASSTMKSSGGVLFLLTVLANAVLQLSAAIELTADVDVTDSQLICPGDTIVFTCTAEGAHIIKWLVPPIITNSDPLTLSSPGDARERSGVVARLISENAMGDIESTLQVDITREIEAIVCLGGQNDINVTISDNIMAPPPPQTIHHQVSDSGVTGATIELSWASSGNSGEPNSPANYSLYVNDELEAVVGTSTTHLLNVQYNTLYVVTVADSNCVGTTHSMPYEITVVGCSLPLPPVRGTIDLYERVIEGTGISYQCDRDLLPMGSFTSECTHTGEWYPNPANVTCQADCGVPFPPTGGHIQNYCSTLENSELFYRCDSGYSPTNLMKSTCTAEGTWYPKIAALICTVDCGVPDEIVNGVLEVNGSTTEGSIVHYYCSQDQPPLQEEKMSSTCMSNGLWVPDPSQLLCTEHGCGTPTAPENGEITGYQSPQLEDSDLTVMFRCKDGFQPAELRTAVCAPNGSWSPNPADLTCTSYSITEGGISVVLICATSSAGTFIVSLIVGIIVGVFIGRITKTGKQISDQQNGKMKLEAENPLYGELVQESEKQSDIGMKEHQYDIVAPPHSVHVPRALSKQPDAQYDEVALDNSNSKFNVLPNVSYAST